MKLANKLLQTNERNHRYYKTSSICPGCQKQEETLHHVWSCDFPETETVRQALLTTYKHTLDDCLTPEPISESILHGIASIIQVLQGRARRPIPLTIGDIALAHLTDAYSSQTRIGWEPFLRGRVGKPWGAAYKYYYPDCSDQEVMTWLSDVVRATMDFTMQLWKHRNALVHGVDLAAAKVKQRRHLQSQVQEAYKRYRKDPFVISRRQSSLFESRTLHQRLQQDVDCLKCWLAEVELAEQAQRDFRIREVEAAQKFFRPRATENLVAYPIESASHASETSCSEGESTQTYDDREEDSLSTATYDFSLTSVSSSWPRWPEDRLTPRDCRP